MSPCDHVMTMQSMCVTSELLLVRTHRIRAPEPLMGRRNFITQVLAASFNCSILAYMVRACQLSSLVFIARTDVFLLLTLKESVDSQHLSLLVSYATATEAEGAAGRASGGKQPKLSYLGRSLAGGRAGLGSRRPFLAKLSGFSSALMPSRL